MTNEQLQAIVAAGEPGSVPISLRPGRSGLAAAVALMLTGAAMIVSGSSSAIAFSLIAVGLVLTVIARVDKQRRHPGS